MSQKIQHTKILITAGPTREYLDPVRFITNESSGKMGYAIAENLHILGADVTLISGPVAISTTFPKERIILIKTANEMFETSKSYFDSTDIAVFSAAVADYRPKFQSTSKIKKSEMTSNIEFVKNTDIAFEFGKSKSNKQVSIGFALETDNIIENASKKMKTKKFDAIVINSPKENEGFGFDTNKISILNKNGRLTNYELKSKDLVAKDIINEIIELMQKK